MPRLTRATEPLTSVLGGTNPKSRTEGTTSIGGASARGAIVATSRSDAESAMGKDASDEAGFFTLPTLPDAASGAAGLDLSDSDPHAIGMHTNAVAIMKVDADRSQPDIDGVPVWGAWGLPVWLGTGEHEFACFVLMFCVVAMCGVVALRTSTRHGRAVTTPRAHATP